MKHFKTFIYLISAIVILSCNPKLYTPNTQNVPLISEKGQINLTASGNANQIEFQGAYGIAEKFAIQLNGGLFIPSDLDNGNGGSGKFVEVGAGYFKPISTDWLFEVYGLVGIGSVENHLPSTINDAPQTKGDLSANILRIGVQPNFGYISEHFSAAISSRIVNLTYNKIEGDLIFEGQNYSDYLNDKNSNFLIEPAFTVRAGFEKIKLQLQYGYSLNLSNSDFRQDHSFLTLGLNFNLK